MPIFIPGNVPSSKNSKRWTGKMLINSKTTMKYISKSKGDYLINKNYLKVSLNPTKFHLNLSEEQNTSLITLILVKQFKI